MFCNVTCIVFQSDRKESYSNVLKTILNSSWDRKRYEIIFLGYREKGFSHVVLYKEDPLVRAFYDGILSRTQRINAAVAEAHCPMILIWPGFYFLKSNFRPIPQDVVDPEYYLMLWMRFNNAAEDPIFPWDTMKPVFKPFRKHQYNCNLKDTLRFLYKAGELPWRVKLWYWGWMIKALFLKLTGRG